VEGKRCGLAADTTANGVVSLFVAANAAANRVVEGWKAADTATYGVVRARIPTDAPTHRVVSIRVATDTATYRIRKSKVAFHGAIPPKVMLVTFYRSPMNIDMTAWTKKGYSSEQPKATFVPISAFFWLISPPLVWLRSPHNMTLKRAGALN
jgi:hypothetical protein